MPHHAQLPLLLETAEASVQPIPTPLPGDVCQSMADLLLHVGLLAASTDTPHKETADEVLP